jgi:hypothetical protein
MPPRKQPKRKATTPLQETPSPVHSLTPLSSPAPSPVRDIKMEIYIASVDAKLALLISSMEKLPVIETALNNLVKENTSLRQDLAEMKIENKKKDEAILQLTEHCNRLDQSSRSTSLRIVGLPVTASTTQSELMKIVFRDIITPVLEAAEQNGEIPPSSEAAPHYLVDNVFILPSKNNTPNPVILKLSTQFMRGLIFRYKKAALPTVRDTVSNKDRNKFSIFEDLSPANHAIFRSFALDKQRIKSAWTFGGQVRFKTHDSETVYKVRSITDSYETLVKPPTSQNMAH